MRKNSLFGVKRSLPGVAVLACLMLAGCASDPKSLGITGPGIHTVPPPEAATDDATRPGVTQAGTSYSNSMTPTRGATGFWGYNN